MKKKLSSMSPEEFKAFSPRTQEEGDAYEEESEFRQWCEENERDFQDEDTRKEYATMQPDQWWANLDPNDREGHEHNMNKDD